MKTKILLTLTLSLFCLDGLATKGRSLVRPNKAGQVEAPTAFKEIPLRATENCNGSCVQAAKEGLSPKGVRILNETPATPEKEDFMGILPPLYGKLMNFHNRSNLDEIISVMNVSAQHEIAMRDSQKSTTAIASAVNKSVVEGWPETAKQNLQEFVTGLADGVSPLEAEKLKQVQENCI